MPTPALIREADLHRMARVVRKQGVEVRVEFGADGTKALVMGPAASRPATDGNALDEMFG